MRPRTGAEYSWDLSPELARNWSAASQRRFSSVAVTVSFSPGAIQRINQYPPFFLETIMAEYARERAKPYLFLPRALNPKCVHKSTWADTTTSHGRLMLTVLGGLA